MDIGFKIVSADSHLEVSPDRWRDWVEPQYRDCVPKVIRMDNGGDAWVLPNSPAPVPLGANFAAGIPRRLWNRMITYEENPAGSGDARQRIAELDQDGVWAEIEFPTVNGQRSLHGLIPPDAYVAVCRGYNTWLSEEFCAVDPKRLLGCALLPATTVDDAIDELTRVASMPGIRTAVLHHWPNGGPNPAPEDDRFWQAAVELGFPLSIHVGLGGGAKTDTDRAPSSWFNHVTRTGVLGANNYTEYCLVQFVLGGVFDRFPDLRLVMAETQVGWLPNFCDGIDRRFQRHQDWAGYTIKELPSAYIRRHFYFSFLDDGYGVAHRDEVGVDRMMWSTDFPHSAGDWPNSREVIDEIFAGVPADELELMLGGNCVRYYGLEDILT